MADNHKLVPLTALKMYLGIDLDDTEQDINLAAIRDAVEDMLCQDTNRDFGLEGNYIEKRDGTGTDTIYTLRPIDVINGIHITSGDAEMPGVWLPVDVNSYLRYVQGKRRLTVVAYSLPEGRLNITIDYDALADQPPMAVQAVKEMCANVYSTRGREGLRSEQMGTYSYTTARSLDESTFWTRAVDRLTIFPTS